MVVIIENILEALKIKHKKDFWLAEVKDGSTWFSSHRRIDFWAMKKSWTNPCTWGYEIKMSRGDFLKDDKWRSYLTLCDQFFFVAPKGVIQSSELPEEAGLLELCGTRLVTRKKAQHRSVVIPEEFYRYILMNRIKSGNKCESNASHWRDWLNEKRENLKLGNAVSKKLRDNYCEMERENDRLKSENEGAKELIKMVDRLGLTVYQLSQIADAESFALRSGLLQSIATVEDDLLRCQNDMCWLMESISDLKKKHGQEIMNRIKGAKVE